MSELWWTSDRVTRAQTWQVMILMEWYYIFLLNQNYLYERNYRAIALNLLTFLSNVHRIMMTIDHWLIVAHKQKQTKNKKQSKQIVVKQLSAIHTFISIVKIVLISKANVNDMDIHTSSWLISPELYKIYKIVMLIWRWFLNITFNIAT